jgi:hypothetical protein
MAIPGNLLTTAMAVMPHDNVDRALKTALSLDIPFWPQLPLLSYYEDMYVQASEHFPGIILDLDQRTLRFSVEKFIEEFDQTLSRMNDPAYLDLSETYSTVYHRFLEMDLYDRPAIHGQLEGPISFGFYVLDQDKRSILFDDTVRPFMLEFMAMRVNAQLQRLKEKNSNAFMFIDEPGLQYLFSAMSGYNNIAAKKDMDHFFSMIERPRGVHLCGNPDWDFLLTADLDILSLDAFSNGEVISSYAGSIKNFLERGGVIGWGIVPTNFEPYNRENIDSLEKRLTDIWNNLTKKGVDLELLLSRSLLSPATCCLINPDREKTVEKAFKLIKQLSLQLRERFNLV